VSSAFDVAIVGGGIAGSATAYFLAAEPAFTGSVLVVEKDSTYEYCAAVRSSGGVRQQWGTPENVAMGLFGAEFIKRAGELLAVDGESPELSFMERGYLLLADAANSTDLQQKFEVQRANGAKTAFLQPHELAARFPWMRTGDLVGGYIGTRNEGWFDPHALLQGYRKKARSLGVTYLEDEVTSVRRQGDRVTGITLRNRGEVSARIVVNSAGALNVARIAATAGVNVPVEPRRRSLFLADCKTPLPGCPFLIDASRAWFRPEGAHFLCAIAPPEENDPPREDYDVDYASFDEVIWPRLAHRIPAFESLKLIRGWSCHYDHNRLDHNAILGPHPEVANFYFATGFSGHGLMQSPATGRAMMELITFGQFRTLDLSRFRYDRLLRNDAVLETAVY
jgi:FAD-dependent oxidoreductase domain-containing protein 1